MTISAEQQAVARFLAATAGAPPRETHISAVFIGPDTVWKLKKAVRMPFLDFTTPDSRLHFLRRELEINQPAAPGLYHDVIGIELGPNGALAFGDTRPIDYVLRMARVPDGDFIEDRLAAHAITPALLDAFGDAVAAYHRQNPVIPGIDFTASMQRIAEGNARSALSAGLPSAEVETWLTRIKAAIGQRQNWFATRSAAGFVRRCHGDLHLGNICLWQGKPVPFDALEFDEALATIDVGYDLGFLLMDLDHRVGRPAANRVMNRYVARTGDAALVAGLPVFLSQRAMIRAHVLAATGSDGSAYLAASLRYLETAPPVVVAIGGLQGTGKSTLARALAPELGNAPGALVLRSDEIRKRLMGIPPEDSLPPDGYTPDANTRTNTQQIHLAKVAADAGHAVVVDATFLDIKVRQALRDAIGRARFLGIWLQAPQPVLEQRIAARTGDASDATIEVLRTAVRNDPGPGNWLAVDSSDAAQALATIRSAISQPDDP